MCFGMYCHKQYPILSGKIHLNSIRSCCIIVAALAKIKHHVIFWSCIIYHIFRVQYVMCIFGILLDEIPCYMVFRPEILTKYASTRLRCNWKYCQISQRGSANLKKPLSAIYSLTAIPINLPNDHAAKTNKHAPRRMIFIWSTNDCICFW